MTGKGTNPYASVAGSVVTDNLAYMKGNDFMKVLIIEPGKIPYEKEIGTNLNAMQETVGGHIEAVYPYAEKVAIVCNEEGKNEMLPLNRALRDEDGNIYDVIAGTFFICGLSRTNFVSLSSNYIEKFKKEFYDPEIFMMVNGKIIAKKIKGQNEDRDDRDER